MRIYLKLLLLLLVIISTMTIKSQTTMTSQLNVKRISAIEELDNQPSYSVSCANWDNFPFDPGTTFRIGRLNDNLILRFTVNESSPRAVNATDFSPVWEDSCVEFFCQIPGNKEYCNFEFNSKGAAVASTRTGQHENVQPFSADKMNTIVRKCTVEADRWSVEISIPINHIVDQPAYPLLLKGNFYKCGDKCATPHFLSWSPIDNPTPLFHCPQFFGTIVIE